MMEGPRRAKAAGQGWRDTRQAQGFGGANYVVIPCEESLNS